MRKVDSNGRMDSTHFIKKKGKKKTFFLTLSDKISGGKKAGKKNPQKGQEYLKIFFSINE